MASFFVDVLYELSLGFVHTGWRYGLFISEIGLLAVAEGCGAVVSCGELVVVELLLASRIVNFVRGLVGFGEAGGLAERIELF